MLQNDSHNGVNTQEQQQKFREIFFVYHPKVLKFITSIVKSESVAEDIAQDIFVQIWHDRDKSEGILSLNGYVYRMARNAALDYLKHQAVSRRYMQYTESHASELNQAEEEYHAREIELMIEIVVSQMPDKRRIVFNMSRHQGLKNEYIAQKLGISKKTVENHLNIALNEIRKVLVATLVFFSL